LGRLPAKQIASRRHANEASESPTIPD